MKGNKKFDIDLKYGQIREDKVKDMFSNVVSMQRLVTSGFID